MTANEIQNLADGIPITRLEGVLKETYKPKTGTSAKGDWQVQDAVLQLDDGEVRLKAWNLGDLKNLKGKRIVIEAHKSEKHGWTGVQKEVEEYNGKVYHKIKLTESCKISQANGAQPSKEPQAARPQQTQAPSQDTTVEYDADSAIKNATDFAVKAANALLISLRETKRAADSFEREYLGTEVPPAQRQAMTSSIFIGLHKEGLVNPLPSQPIKSLVRESVLPAKPEPPPRTGSDDEIPW